MSEIVSVRIDYRDDCFQLIRLVEPIPEEHARAIACMVLTMSNDEECTPDRVDCLDDSGASLTCLQKGRCAWGAL